MKNSIKATKKISLAMVFIQLSYIIILVIRKWLYQEMLNNNVFLEAIIAKIVSLDHIANMLEALFMTITIMLIAYLFYRVCSTILRNECKIAVFSLLICLLLSIIAINLLKLPLYHFQDQEYLGIIVMICITIIYIINAIKQYIHYHANDIIQLDNHKASKHLT